jgi:hypothetical protein
VISFLRSLFKRLPGRSLESLVTITGLHKVGLVRRITKIERVDPYIFLMITEICIDIWNRFYNHETSIVLRSILLNTERTERTRDHQLPSVYFWLPSINLYLAFFPLSSGSIITDVSQKTEKQLIKLQTELNIGSSISSTSIVKVTWSLKTVVFPPQPMVWLYHDDSITTVMFVRMFSKMERWEYD